MRPNRRHVGGWLIAIALHLLLLLALVHGAPRTRLQAGEQYVLVMIAVPEPQLQPPATPADTGSIVRASRRAATVSLPAASNARTAIPADTATEDSPTAEPVDWQRAASTAIRDGRTAATRLATQRTFGELPKSPFIRCEKPRDEFAWSPEPKRAGIAGGLPYVRLGDHCVLGLGFAGCALGKLPEANSQLFAHMRDDARPGSSVPEITGCVRNAEAEIP